VTFRTIVLLLRRVPNRVPRSWIFAQLPSHIVHNDYESISFGFTTLGSKVQHDVELPKEIFMSIHRTNIFNNDKKIIYRKQNTHRYYIRVRTTTKCCEHVLDKILTRLTESSNIRFVLTNRQKTRRQDFFYNNSYTLHTINNTMKFVVYNTAVFFFFLFQKNAQKPFIIRHHDGFFF